ncbi:MAG: hypothetical protein QXZ08_03935 [Nitrososphaeria archaeon]
MLQDTVQIIIFILPLYIPIILMASTAIRHSNMYFIALSVPYLGAWYISFMFLTYINVPITILLYLVSLIPSITVTILHLFSRMSHTILGRVALSTLSKISLAELSPIFILFSFLSFTNVEIDFLRKTEIYDIPLYVILLLIYCSTSLIPINNTYRYRLVCKKENTNNIEKKINVIFKTLLQKFLNTKDNVELLRYYFLDTISNFEEGSYELAFLSAYKIIREQTVIDPRGYIDDKREGEPSSFSEIRTILIHSRRKDVEIRPKIIRETKTKLPQYTLEVIERALTFLKKLSEQTTF